MQLDLIQGVDPGHGMLGIQHGAVALQPGFDRIGNVRDGPHARMVVKRKAQG